jgi:hypothetical protein
MSKISGVVSAAIGGAKSVFFGPGKQIAPVYPDQQQAQAAGAAGRLFDYRVGQNISYIPRSTEVNQFAQLRAAADFYMVRMLIETVKNQILQCQWDVAPKKKGAKVDESRIEAARSILENPAPGLSRDKFVRLLFEDDLAIGAPSVYVRRTLGGDLWGFEVIDGSTISLLIDNTGRVPIEGPAYRQVIKGLPAVDYTRDELIYMPSCPINGRVYATSPVEQILDLVAVMMRRHIRLSDYFTKGTVPDGIAGAPEGWTSEQISDWQKYWDHMIAAEESGEDLRRSLRFVPKDMADSFRQTIEPELKGMIDEWFIRLACYQFSIDPTPFVAQVNRSVAETSRQQALMEGLEPRKLWLAQVQNRMLELAGFGDLVVAWPEGQINDPMLRTQIVTAQLQAKLITEDEAREMIGRPAWTPEQLAQRAEAKAAAEVATQPAPAEPPPPTPAEVAKAWGVADPPIVDTAVHLHLGGELVDIIRAGVAE